MMTDLNPAKMIILWTGLTIQWKNSDCKNGEWGESKNQVA